ncbi:MULTISPECIES: bifunctional GNAT family N-acetyltransferase/hotdog fold thioesterase [Vibrio]|uniref:bifunctional GNAT family N-acetyltransferase/hotdog fold thioesterase n=1 Tax=Vibrio TaxID=662 RepID=UPI001865A490|nr:MULTISPECIES: bifunctional GNAT family N-acetyltransferase/hotdog fold thioesterase [Vibrio]MCF7355341.1 bifunctional GNAT family N-acetyltransferase/hotdog fold thioesterase [Vibrio sp. CK2-1]
MFKLVTPKTESDLQNYYHFRWQMLREPFHQPQGSERDEYDDMSAHRMIVDGRGRIMAVGRMYLTPNSEGQIRYMAVHPQHRGKGLGSLILVALESYAMQEGAKRLVCNSREDAINFYAKNGFESQGELSDERGPTRHQQMLKRLKASANVSRRPDWCDELQKRWRQEIPICAAMGIRISQYTGYQFECSAPLNPNINPHETMFAGSLFTLTTLTGWGMAWLLMREKGLEADIILADSQVRFRAPVTQSPVAVTSLDGISGDLDRLVSGRRARVIVKVTVYSGDVAAVEFTGTYMLMTDFLGEAPLVK